MLTNDKLIWTTYTHTRIEESWGRKKHVSVKGEYREGGGRRCGANYCTWRFRVNTWVRRLTVARATGCGCGRRAVVRGKRIVQRELETDEERSRMIKSKAKFLAAPCHGLNSLTFSSWLAIRELHSEQRGNGELWWGVREGVLDRYMCVCNWWHDSPYTSISITIYVYVCMYKSRLCTTGVSDSRWPRKQHEHCRHRPIHQQQQQNSSWQLLGHCPEATSLWSRNVVARADFYFCSWKENELRGQEIIRWFWDIAKVSNGHTLRERKSERED